MSVLPRKKGRFCPFKSMCAPGEGEFGVKGGSVDADGRQRRAGLWGKLISAFTWLKSGSSLNPKF